MMNPNPPLLLLCSLLVCKYLVVSAYSWSSSATSSAMTEESFVDNKSAKKEAPAQSRKSESRPQQRSGPEANYLAAAPEGTKENSFFCQCGCALRKYNIDGQLAKEDESKIKLEAEIRPVAFAMSHFEDDFQDIMREEMFEALVTDGDVITEYSTIVAIVSPGRKSVSEKEAYATKKWEEKEKQTKNERSGSRSHVTDNYVRNLRKWKETEDAKDKAKYEKRILETESNLRISRETEPQLFTATDTTSDANQAKQKKLDLWQPYCEYICTSKAFPGRIEEYLLHETHVEFGILKYGADPFRDQMPISAEAVSASYIPLPKDEAAKHETSAWIRRKFWLFDPLLNKLSKLGSEPKRQEFFRGINIAITTNGSQVSGLPKAITFKSDPTGCNNLWNNNIKNKEAKTWGEMMERYGVIRDVKEVYPPGNRPDIQLTTPPSPPKPEDEVEKTKTENIYVRVVKPQIFGPSSPKSKMDADTVAEEAVRYLVGNHMNPENWPYDEEANRQKWKRILVKQMLPAHRVAATLWRDPISGTTSMYSTYYGSKSQASGSGSQAAQGYNFLNFQMSEELRRTYVVQLNNQIMSWYRRYLEDLFTDDSHLFTLKMGEADVGDRLDQVSGPETVEYGMIHQQGPQSQRPKKYIHNANLDVAGGVVGGKAPNGPRGTVNIQYSTKIPQARTEHAQYIQQFRKPSMLQLAAKESDAGASFLQSQSRAAPSSRTTVSFKEVDIAKIEVIYRVSFFNVCWAAENPAYAKSSTHPYVHNSAAMLLADPEKFTLSFNTGRDPHTVALNFGPSVVQTWSAKDGLSVLLHERRNNNKQLLKAYDAVLYEVIYENLHDAFGLHNTETEERNLFQRNTCASTDPFITLQSQPAPGIVKLFMWTKIRGFSTVEHELKDYIEVMNEILSRCYGAFLPGTVLFSSKETDTKWTCVMDEANNNHAWRKQNISAAGSATPKAASVHSAVHPAGNVTSKAESVSSAGSVTSKAESVSSAGSVTSKAVHSAQNPAGSVTSKAESVQSAQQAASLRATAQSAAQSRVASNVAASHGVFNAGTQAHSFAAGQSAMSATAGGPYAPNPVYPNVNYYSQYPGYQPYMYGGNQNTYAHTPYTANSAHPQYIGQAQMATFQAPVAQSFNANANVMSHLVSATN